MGPQSCGSIVLLVGVLGSGCFLDWDAKKADPDAMARSDAVAPDAGAGDAGSASDAGDAAPYERCVLGQGRLPCKLGD